MLGIVALKVTPIKELKTMAAIILLTNLQFGKGLVEIAQIYNIPFGAC